MEFELKVQNFDPPLQVHKCQHRPHPDISKQPQIEEECFAPFRNSVTPNSTKLFLGPPNDFYMIPRYSLDDPGSILATLKNHHFHPKIVKISPDLEVFQVPLAKVRVEIERRKKMSIPGL